MQRWRDLTLGDVFDGLARYRPFVVTVLVHEWAAEHALDYYTGRRATFVLAGELWDHDCPGDHEVDRVFRFGDLLRGRP